MKCAFFFLKNLRFRPCFASFDRHFAAVGEFAFVNDPEAAGADLVFQGEVVCGGDEVGEREFLRPVGVFGGAVWNAPDFAEAADFAGVKMAGMKMECHTVYRFSDRRSIEIGRGDKRRIHRNYCEIRAGNYGFKGDAGHYATRNGTVSSPTHHGLIHSPDCAAVITKPVVFIPQAKLPPALMSDAIGVAPQHETLFEDFTTPQVNPNPADIDWKSDESDGPFCWLEIAPPRQHIEVEPFGGEIRVPAQEREAAGAHAAEYVNPAGDEIERYFRIYRHRRVPAACPALNILSGLPRYNTADGGGGAVHDGQRGGRAAEGIGGGRQEHDCYCQSQYCSGGGDRS
nr:hypothetical protein Iba_chr05fCG13220 [Ipomoea batatas]